MDDIRYPMKMVTQRTGLTSHVVRVWERRYGAVTPDRSGSNRRLYSEEDIHRLDLMGRLTRAGHSIGNIAKLGTPELEKMADDLPMESFDDPETDGANDQPAVRSGMEAVGVYIDRAWKAIGELNASGLQQVFEDASRDIGGSAMIENVIVPLTVKIGEGWDSGEISVAQERAASTVIQEVLLIAGRPHSETSGAPNLLVATPVGQLHEVGASLVVCIARRRGWAVTYLGASIPADEIAHAAKLNKSCAVALSIVYPADDPQLAEELGRLRRLLDDDCELLAGGQASDAYATALDELGAKRLCQLDDLKAWLDAKRKQRAEQN